MINILLAIARRIDGMNRIAGIAANWLVLLAALVCALDALLRYGLGSLVLLGSKMGSSGAIFNSLFALYRDNSNSLRDLQLDPRSSLVVIRRRIGNQLNQLAYKD